MLKYGTRYMNWGGLGRLQLSDTGVNRRVLRETNYDEITLLLLLLLYHYYSDEYYSNVIQNLLSY